MNDTSPGYGYEKEREKLIFIHGHAGIVYNIYIQVRSFKRLNQGSIMIIFYIDLWANGQWASAASCSMMLMIRLWTWNKQCVCTFHFFLCYPSLTNDSPLLIIHTNAKLEMKPQPTTPLINAWYWALILTLSLSFKSHSSLNVCCCGSNDDIFN